MAQLGFVGLGMMGSRMVQRLMQAGHHVTGHNRSQSKAAALIQQGMGWADSPRAAAENSDIVISNVAHGEALEAVTAGPDGILAGLRPGQIYIDMSTVSPMLVEALAAQAAALGAHMLDAPVSGSKLTLEQGKLVIMVSGDRRAFEQAQPILEAIGPTVNYIGPSGQAMALKLAINISIAVQILTFIEGVLLAERYGVPRKQAVEVMLSGAIASPAMRYRGPFVAEMPDEAWFDVDMMQKDLWLALDLADELGVPMPTTRVTNDLLSATRDLGLADQDFAIMYRALEHQAGLGN